MAVRVKIPVLDTKTVFNVNGIASKETIGRAFSEMARADIKRIDAQNAAVAGRKLPLKTFVGTTEQAVPAFVDPSATIRARWEVALGAVAYAYNLLGEARPAKSGRYRNLRRIYADGKRVKTPEETIGAKEVAILSVVPYARKIERGKKGYAPGQVYQAVTALTAARYSNVARIKFTFFEPLDDAGPLDIWAHQNAAKQPTTRKRMKKLHYNRRQPAILFYLG